MDTLAYDVTWNGAIDRQFAEDVRIQAAHPQGYERPFPTRHVFRPGCLGSVLEAAIRASTPGAVFTPRSVGEFLNIPSNTAASMLRKAWERGLLDVGDGTRDNQGRWKKSGAHTARYLSREVR
jgi:hypothetical protein